MNTGSHVARVSVENKTNSQNTIVKHSNKRKDQGISDDVKLSVIEVLMQPGFVSLKLDKRTDVEGQANISTGWNLIEASKINYFFYLNVYLLKQKGGHFLLYRWFG